MSNSTTLLDTISSSQASKEVTANALFDAASPATLYGRHASATANLTWGYYGGYLNIAGTPTAVANGTKTLTNGATNYIEAQPTTGNVSVNTSGFTAANIPLYSVVTAGNLITSYTDLRCGGLDAATANQTIGGTLTVTGNLKPAANGVPTIGQGGLGFKELFLDYTNTATVGNVTINKASGRAIVAAGAANVVIANSLVTANCHVMGWASQNDANGRVTSVVPTAGNITINCSPVPAANMSVDFIVFGAD
jgi:hypothetical protein